MMASLTFNELKCKIARLQIQIGLIRNAVKKTYLQGRKKLTFYNEQGDFSAKLYLRII